MMYHVTTTFWYSNIMPIRTSQGYSWNKDFV